MQKFFPFLGPILCVGTLAFAPCKTATAQMKKVELERSGLVYALGRVDRVANGSAQIDLGDVHTLRRGERVAIIRPVDNYYVPVGLFAISETYSTYSRAAKATGLHPQEGDIALFVREFSQLKTADQHRDSFVKQEIIKNAGNNRYSTFGRSDVAIALADYRSQYDTWERSKRDVIGYLAGKSFAGGKHTAVEPLLKQIDMMREFLRDGRNSLPAAGDKWVSVMSLLTGPTASAQHQAAQKVETDDDFSDEESTGPTIRDIQREVKDKLFDRLDEEQKLVSFLVATILEEDPPRLELWFDHNVRRSQFPLLAEEVSLIDDVRRVLQTLRRNDI